MVSNARKQGGDMVGTIGEEWAGRHLLITQRLRQRRADLGLTQKQVVSRLARAGLHTTNRTVSGLEHGAGVDVARLPEIAAALDCTVTYLVGLTTDPHRWEPDAATRDAVSPAASRRRPAALRNPRPATGEAGVGATESLIISSPATPRHLDI